MKYLRGYPPGPRQPAQARQRGETPGHPEVSHPAREGLKVTLRAVKRTVMINGAKVGPRVTGATGLSNIHSSFIKGAQNEISCQPPGAAVVTSSIVETNQSVILFDGHCHLCNVFVRFVLCRDPAGQFRFSPLQSEFARRRLNGLHLNSVVLVERDGIYFAEAAALMILARLGRPWSWVARVAWWLPGPVLAATYRFVARHRYRIFGRDEVCGLPLPGWKERFLQ
jgi:predicted DCC family thiol-disulfide oxidoreductase YuxK